MALLNYLTLVWEDATLYPIWVDCGYQCNCATARNFSKLINL